MTPPGAPAAATDRHEHVDVLEGAAEVAHLTRLASSVRHHQRLMARAFLALLADRRGWASRPGLPGLPRTALTCAAGDRLRSRVGTTRAGGRHPVAESKDETPP